jgi:hypothetical protein
LESIVAQFEAEVAEIAVGQPSQIGARRPSPLA